MVPDGLLEPTEGGVETPKAARENGMTTGMLGSVESKIQNDREKAALDVLDAAKVRQQVEGRTAANLAAWKQANADYWRVVAERPR